MAKSSSSRCLQARRSRRRQSVDFAIQRLRQQQNGEFCVCLDMTRLWQTALHVAASRGHADVVKVLLDAKASVNAEAVLQLVRASGCVMFVTFLCTATDNACVHSGVCEASN